MCPRLTHMKTTGLDVFHASVITGLRQSLEIPFSSVWENEHSSFRLPPLHHVILQPSLHSWLRKRRDKEEMASLARLVSLMTPHGLAMEAPTTYMMDYWNAKVGWLDRLNGGEGCWEVRQRILV